MEDYRIKVNSWIAKIAALKLRSDNAAIVIGKTIHLYGTSKQNFLHNKQWLKHELCHVKQFKQYGFINFIVKYLWESVRRGYYNNRFEKEARTFEKL
ncbi:MAG: DUF4157 domain-containing protein [Bacteroidota bacterium]|nr:DUF4157 domain-containing protein [Bacteroidota bacterium]